MGDASYIEILDTTAGPRNRPVAPISSLDNYIVIDSVVAIGAATLPRIERLATNLRTPPLATAATSPRQPSPTQDASRASEALRDNYIHTSTADNLDARGRSVSQRPTINNGLASPRAAASWCCWRRWPRQAPSSPTPALRIATASAALVEVRPGQARLQPFSLRRQYFQQARASGHFSDGHQWDLRYATGGNSTHNGYKWPRSWRAWKDVAL